METGKTKEQRFGQELLRSHLLTESQLRTSLEYQESLGGKLRDIVLKLGFVSDDRLNDFIARKEHVKTVDLEELELEEALMAKIPRSLLEQHEVLPVRQGPESVLLVTSEPFDLRVVEEVQFLTGCSVEVGLAPRTQIRERIARWLDGREPPPETPDSIAHVLLDRVSDPVVAALARALIQTGILDPLAWKREFEEHS